MSSDMWRSAFYVSKQRRDSLQWSTGSSWTAVPLKIKTLSSFETSQQLTKLHGLTIYSSVSQPPGRGPVPGPGINYTGPREVLLEFVILVF